MFSKILIKKDNLYHNVDVVKKLCRGGKICAMVKANAYGHGLQQITSLLMDKVDAFGVVNIGEAMLVHAVCKNKPVILFGVCEDVKLALTNNISLTITSLTQFKNILDISKKVKKMPLLHLNINTGMNRFGVKDNDEIIILKTLLEQHNIKLQGVFTHFSSLTTDKNYSLNQKQKLDESLALLNDNSITTHVGGGYAYQFKGYQMYRTGMFLYGYGLPDLLPVMEVRSCVVEVQHAKAGEHVGYMCSYTAMKDMDLAIIPLGYADGIKRGLSNKFEVKINGKVYKNIGNICMDCFMIDVTGTDVKLGDEVVVLEKATNWNDILNTTEYEILTNFNSFRGKRVII